jgi:hypothetical protein
MTEDPGTDQQPPKPDQQPPKDDIRWLIYLAVGFVVVLALLLLSACSPRTWATDQAFPAPRRPAAPAQPGRLSRQLRCGGCAGGGG